MNIDYDISCALPPKPAKDQFNHLIDMTPLVFLTGMIRRILALYYPRLDWLPEISSEARVIERLRRYERRVGEAIARAKLHNFKVRLKAAMLGECEWRAQVLDALGGGEALSRWERLQESYHRRVNEAALNPEAPLSYTPLDMAALERGEVETVPIRKAVPTDTNGFFRLAPIGRYIRPRVDLTEVQKDERRRARALRREWRHKRWEALSLPEKYAPQYMPPAEFLHGNGAPEDWIFNIRPIPVTPRELRGRSSHPSCNAGQGYGPQSHDTARQALRNEGIALQCAPSPPLIPL